MSDRHEEEQPSCPDIASRRRHDRTPESAAQIDLKGSAQYAAMGYKHHHPERKIAWQHLLGLNPEELEKRAQA